jgi:SprB repeat
MKKLVTSLNRFSAEFILVLFFAFGFYQYSAAQTTIAAGSFIIDMGVTPQTISNGLKPYGLVYEMLKTYSVPVEWIINTSKIKDGVDFNYNGKDYKGGPFVIETAYRTTAVNTSITTWQALGVVGLTTTAPITIATNYVTKIYSAPRWTLDKQNGAIAQGYLNNAGIPATAYGGSTNENWKNPADLGACDDIFAMPHADPTWATHNNLIAWNSTYKGSIWLGCTAGSALHNMFNPANINQQGNFLTDKTMVSTAANPNPGSGQNTGVILPVLGVKTYSQNTLLLWTNHNVGSLPYTYENSGDPVMQFIGSMDASLTYGAEQIYIPMISGGWLSSTTVSVYDPDHTQKVDGAYNHRAALVVYGYGFGNSNNGKVMIQAAHSATRDTKPDNIAAQRAFLNFSLLAAKVTAPEPTVTFELGTIASGSSSAVTFSLGGTRTVSEFDIVWSSSCGGSFSSTNTQNTTFTAPGVAAPTTCLLTVTLTEKAACGKVYSSSVGVNIICSIVITPTVHSSCSGQNNGSIEMSINGGATPYVWTWTKSGGGSGNGSGTTISNLVPGAYSVHVISANGAGCDASFTTTIIENSQISLSSLPTNILCYGSATGAINASLSGGTPPYTYSWSNGASTQNLSQVVAGSYTLTVTDSKGCTASTSSTITQPTSIVATPSVTNVTSNGLINGAVSLTVSGGVSTYTYLWNDGGTTKDRTGLAAGTYSVIVTDANGCLRTVSGITVTQPAALTLSAVASAILCYGGGNSTITATGGGGVGSLQYSLNGGTYQSSNIFSNVAVSSTPNTVTVKDGLGITKSTAVTVSQPAPIVLSFNKTNESCPSALNGAVTLTTTGGTGSYTYDWADVSGANNSKDRTGLAAGTYTVTVTDSNGCTATSSVIIADISPNPVIPGTITK